MLRAEAQRNHTFIGQSRRRRLRSRRARLQPDAQRTACSARLDAGSIRKSLFNDFRVPVRGRRTRRSRREHRARRAGAERVQQPAARRSAARAIVDQSTSPTISTSPSAGTRSGPAFLIEAGQYRTDVRRNAGGTFTFAEPRRVQRRRARRRSRATSATRASPSRRRRPALYIQDDYRARKDLTISGGVRQEYQSHVGGFHLGPRGGFAWSPFKSGKTTVRARRRHVLRLVRCRRATSRPCSSMARISRSKQSCSPAIPTHGSAGARSCCRTAACSSRRVSSSRGCSRQSAGIEQTLPGDVAR